MKHQRDSLTEQNRLNWLVCTDVRTTTEFYCEEAINRASQSEFFCFRKVKGCDYGDSSVAKEPQDVTPFSSPVLKLIKVNDTECWCFIKGPILYPF